MKSFTHHLEHWRKEPEVRRERRALLLASGLTLCLFVLWLASFRLTTSLRETPATAIKIKAADSIASPGIIERIKAGWQTITK